MLINNAALPHHSHASLASNDDTFSASSPLFSRLSMLSKRPRWLLFTAEATLPTIPELVAFGIDASKVVKIKASLSMTEKDIILKAISAKNASAIVSSDNFSCEDKASLILKAKEVGCEIFFMDQSIRQTLIRNLH
ncbi:hypothetical protein [Vibrio rumoiensis]|uniref:Uncharacterized protein n=1 Tax=Vibrio rumoiensis 1S-45 TaxID=1188252 RepID=A0A1E5E0Y6_9VIBR|nr:hypothetical protein [Vibrio rumoiensis]OEF24148.1 hypothetical protein A1QC_10930 [Vibrio rumoiensis 1S-45]